MPPEQEHLTSHPPGFAARRWDRNHGGSIAIPATYLESALTLR